MTKNPYRVEGTFLMGDRWTKFSVETVASDEAAAREQILSNLGSRHRVNRRRIQVDSVSAISVDQVEDSVVEALATSEE